MKIMINNKTTAVWAVVAVVLFAGVWYLFASNAGTYTEVIEDTATTTPAAETPVVKAPVKKAPAPVAEAPAPLASLRGVESLKQLLAREESLKCAVESMSGPKRTGALYVSKGGKARADFASSSMIDDGEYLYAWETGASTGTKLLATVSVSGSVIAAAGGVDPATTLRYACNPWTEDAAVFALPEGVTF